MTVFVARFELIGHAGYQHGGARKPGPVTDSERAYCQHLARNVFRGIGELVELGCFLSASPESFAAGLSKNEMVQ